METKEITREQMLEAMGWTIECESPLEIRHTDEGFASGKSAELMIESIVKEYKLKKGRDDKQAEEDKKNEVLRNLDFKVINGSEIIDFINKEGLGPGGDITFVSQTITNSNDIEMYTLEFEATWNNWGHESPCDCQIYIDNNGIQACLDEPIEGNGDEEIIEEELYKWLKTHTFFNDHEEKFDGLLREVYDSLPELHVNDKEGFQKIIDKLTEAQTYMK